MPITKPISVIANDVFNSDYYITEVDLKEEADLQHHLQLNALLAEVYERRNASSPWVHTRSNTSTAVIRQSADIRRGW